MINTIVDISNMQINPDLAEALEDLEAAKNHLDQAVESDMIEAACYELSAAELQVRAAIKRAKANNFF